MTPAELQPALRSVEPAAVLVSARVLENVIRQASHFSGLLWRVPHRKSFTADRQTLFRHVEQEELALRPDQLLPLTVILLAWPEPEELQAAESGPLMLKYWQRLFHASVHLVLENLCTEGKLTPADFRARIDRLGPTLFAEIRTVLLQDDYLAPDPDERSVFIEFAAVYLELTFFAPHLVPIYFPAIRDTAAIDLLLNQDVDAKALYQRTRPAGASEPAARIASSFQEAHEYYWKLVRSSARAAQQGNVVLAAIQRWRAARMAPPALAYDTRQEAIAELQGLVDRLRNALSLTTAETEEWRKHLPTLLDKADQGTRPVEAALLYDLEQVCLDHEREIYAMDLVEWLLSAGKRPIKRPLPSQRAVRVARTLRGTSQRLTLARLSDGDRSQFATLLQEAVHRSEDQVRQRFRPLLTSALQDVGLKPHDPLEATALRKVIEELLDRIIASGFVTFSELRDTLSRNQMKLPDLADPQDFIRGDPLLRLDRRLARLLDGVYRPSEFYLRWMERFTALNFGTPLGRLLTLFVTVPFVGAFLLVEAVAMGLDKLDCAVPAAAYYPAVALLGFFLMGLIHSAQARKRCVQIGIAAGRPLRIVLVDGPLWLLRHTSLKDVAASWPFQLAYWYVVKPLILTGLLTVFIPEPYQTLVVIGVTFLGAMFFLNSRPGQAAGEAVSQIVIGFVDLLRGGLIPGLINFVSRLFKYILHLGEALLFTVDEWLRFRGGESRPAMALRAVLSLLWFPVAYLIRFNMVVLIEPGINPLKYPIAAIATKFMLPFAPQIREALTGVSTPALGNVLGELVTLWIMFWLPDVVAFVVWEMKENWSLYRANRRQALGPVSVGGHGETMRGLLAPGFHSGTVPKLFLRLRKAERTAWRTSTWSGVRACQSALAEVEEAVHLFVTREFCELLGQTPAWASQPPRVRAVTLATSQIRVELQHADFPDQPLFLEFEIRGSWLIAGIVAPAWLLALPAGQRILLDNALATLYKRAGVDRIREQLPAVDASTQPPTTFCDIPITWEQCVKCWQTDPAALATPRLLGDGLTLFPAPLPIRPETIDGPPA